MSEQESLDAEVGGQKLSLKTNNLNTVATVATLMLVSALCVVAYLHTSDTKEARAEAKDMSREFVSAMKEMTIATRENNCLQSFSSERREVNADLCKRMSR